MSRVRTLNWSSTSTGTVGTVDLYQVVGTVTANVNNPSTEPLAWRMQGSLADVAWTNLNAAATTTTGTAMVNSTVAGSYNRVRILVTASSSTGGITTKWTVAGRP